MPTMLKHRSVLLIILGFYAIATTCGHLFIVGYIARHGSITITEPNRLLLFTEALIFTLVIGFIITTVIYHFLHRSPP